MKLQQLQTLRITHEKYAFATKTAIWIPKRQPYNYYCLLDSSHGAVSKILVSIRLVADTVCYDKARYVFTFMSKSLFGWIIISYRRVISSFCFAT